MIQKRKSDQQLIIQALNAAETNIRLAKTLLSEARTAAPKPSSKDIPGITGTFDGENMIAGDGKKYSVNPNYASKSVLVYGDTLKRVEVDGQERFKQIARVKRHKVEGILAKKAGKWTAVTADGSYTVSPVAVEFYGGKEGDEVVVVLPVDDKNVPYAALESIKKEEPSLPAEALAKAGGPSKPSGTSVVSAVKKAIKKTSVKREPATKKPTKKKAVVAKLASPEPAEEKPAAPVQPEAEVDQPKADIENDEELR